MSIAIISDTHMPRGTRRLPDGCVERLRAAELVLHSGDLMDESVLELLESLGPPVLAVHGNVDSPALRRRLPEERVVEVGAVAIGMVHDAGPREGRLGRMRRRFGPEVAAVIFGHSHLPLHEEDAGFQIFNPGSPTERRRAPHHTMGLASVDRGRLTFELVALDGPESG